MHLVPHGPYKMIIIVYANGGCAPNPGLGGCGVVSSMPEGPLDLCGGETDSTNNCMELTAAIRALEHFPEGAQLKIRCDSEYVINSVAKWMAVWKANGWRNSKGPVKNLDLGHKPNQGIVVFGSL